MDAFIDAHREAYGVEPICRVLQIAPSGYYAHRGRAADPPSVGSTGDSYDNALAKSVIGLYKAEVIHRRGPWRGFEDVEYATLEWVAWFNQQRLLEPLGYVPPA